MIHVECR